MKLSIARAVLSLAVPAFFALAAWAWFPFGVWLTINQGVIAFLGLVSAALIQVIPVTTNFLQSEELTPHEAEQLTRGLERQQRFWLGLLAATVATFVVVVVASAVPADVKLHLPRIGEVQVGPFVSGLIAFSISFVIWKMCALFGGVLSLQRLRSSLVMASAKRRAAAQVEQHMREAPIGVPVVPASYGEIYRPH